MSWSPTFDGLAAAALITIMALGIAFHPCPAHAGMQSEIELHCYLSELLATATRNWHLAEFP